MCLGLHSLLRHTATQSGALRRGFCLGLVFKGTPAGLPHFVRHQESFLCLLGILHSLKNQPYDCSDNIFSYVNGLKINKSDFMSIRCSTSVTARWMQSLWGLAGMPRGRPARPMEHLDSLENVRLSTGQAPPGKPAGSCKQWVTNFWPTNACSIDPDELKMVRGRSQHKSNRRNTRLNK